MTATLPQETNERLRDAIDDLRALISTAYPAASFAIRPRFEEPTTTLLEVTIDIDDLDAVLDVVSERLQQLQIEDGLPILVVPLRPTVATSPSGTR